MPYMTVHTQPLLAVMLHIPLRLLDHVRPVVGNEELIMRADSVADKFSS